MDKTKTIIPSWIKKQVPKGGAVRKLRTLLSDSDIHTVCEEALCPNRGECFSNNTATFLLMGDVCTRSCGFCATKTGRPEALDPEEPQKIVEAVRKLDLRYVVLTSVNRDELPDGGALHFVKVIQALWEFDSSLKIEVLIPDFQGKHYALNLISEATPTVINHNIESTPRLYLQVRPQANYQQSLDVLNYFKDKNPKAITKSGLMVGLGETVEEVTQVLKDLRKNQVNIITIGQYLSPSKKHLPVREYVSLEKFQTYQQIGMEIGFNKVVSGPMVRSSYLAEKTFQHA